jgi:hypothetical protein
MNMILPRSICALLAICSLAGCQRSSDGLIKHQVTGQVLVNGVPERGIAVCFRHTDVNVTKNAACPVGVTGEDGRFALSTNGPMDGAVSGKYTVTFHWPQGGTSMRDFFNGKYLKVSGPEFEVEVGDQDLEVPSFKLEAPASAVQAAHKGLAVTGHES